MNLRRALALLFVAASVVGCPKKSDDTKSSSSDDKKSDKDKKKSGDDDDAKDNCTLKFVEAAKKQKDNAFDVKCPANCDASSVWGTGWYTTDSSICSAAVHDGAIKSDKGGKVTVTAHKGLKSYKGSKANGVTSADWGSFDGSFSVNDSADGNGTPAKGDKIKLQCSDSVKSVGDDAGDDFTATCPPGCKKGGSVWGTDTYTTDSSICAAAIHAGVVTDDDGGKVHVKVVDGKKSYKGSKKNGVTSSDWGSFEKSFTVE